MPKPDTEAGLEPAFKEQEDHPPFNPFYAEKLLSIAKTFHLDGWFLNIESPVRHAYDAEIMAEFLNYLTKRMKDELPGSKVIWYDSLIVNGDVLWKNKLCQENCTFLQNSDGIFTNYTWKANFPQESVDHLTHAQHQHLLKDKTARDIYTGIDVWGRHTYGGGGWNCHKALKMIKEAGTSTAIFAPGWTYENFDGFRFEDKELKFWCDASIPLELLRMEHDENEKKSSTDVDMNGDFEIVYFSADSIHPA
jgi:endo-beta-N-acetylglucosaminidase D